MEELPSRWEVELEFVQALSNLQYLNFLAQNKYLEDEAFLNYLEYLEYWRRPEYAKHLVYPNCLHILTLLKSPEFRTQILRADFAGSLMNDMVGRWQEPQTLFAPTPLDKTPQNDGFDTTINNFDLVNKDDAENKTQIISNGHTNKSSTEEENISQYSDNTSQAQPSNEDPPQQERNEVALPYS